jgi:hypothetical protein
MHKDRPGFFDSEISQTIGTHGFFFFFFFQIYKIIFLKNKKIKNGTGGYQ